MKRIYTIKTAQNANLFSAQVDVEVYGKGLYFEAMSKALIQYSIDIEYRSYGIKDISVIPIGTVSVSVENEQGQQFELQIDCSRLKTEKNKGSGVWASGLSIWLDQNNQVDYNRSSVDFVCGF